MIVLPIESTVPSSARRSSGGASISISTVPAVARMPTAGRPCASVVVSVPPPVVRSDTVTLKSP